VALRGAPVNGGRWQISVSRLRYTRPWPWKLGAPWRHMAMAALRAVGDDGRRRASSGAARAGVRTIKHGSTVPQGTLVP
jgi:hypothetical protein